MTMKFNSFDELIAYLYGKDISKLTFQIHDESGNENQCNTCNLQDTDTQTLDSPETANVKMMSISDKPSIDFKISSESYILVKEFKHIPNSCTSSNVVIGDRTLFLTICENEDSKPYIRLNVEVNGETMIGKEFFVTTDPEIGNQISL